MTQAETLSTNDLPSLLLLHQPLLRIIENANLVWCTVRFVTIVGVLFISQGTLFGQQQGGRQQNYVDGIKVPEIDPRQYIIIYEWEPSNKIKSLKSATSVRMETDRINRLIKVVRSSATPISERLTKELVKREEFRHIILSRTAQNQSSFAYQDSLEIQETKVRDYEEKIKKIGEEILALETTIHQLKNLQQDPNKKLPYDYFQNIYSRSTRFPKSLLDYYDNLVWRNAAIPDWSPIWWVNLNPWPDEDYRNIPAIEDGKIGFDFTLMPYQKVDIVDYKTTLRVVFDKTRMAENENFKGSVTLKAYLYDGASANADEREIEVNPYSVIGKERESIGLLNKPAKEIASNLISMLIEAKDLISWNNTLDDGNGFKLKEDISKSYAKDSSDFIRYIDDQLADLNSAIETENAEKIETALKKSYNFLFETGFMDEGYYFFSYLNTSDFFNKNYLSYLFSEKDIVKIIKELQLIKTKANEKKTNNKTAYVQHLRQVRHFFDEFKRIYEYLEYFNSEFGETKTAFLSLLNTNRIFYDLSFSILKEEKKNIEGKEKELARILTSTKGQLTEIDEKTAGELIYELYDSKDRIISSLTGLSNIEGSVISSFLESMGYDTDFIREAAQESVIYKVDEWPEFISPYYDKRNYIWNNNKDFPKLIEMVGEKAGEILYQNLIYATIDLDHADAKPGDQIYIMMIWDKDLVSDSSEIAVSKKRESVDMGGASLYVAKFNLKKTGWTYSTVDNGLLVNRIGEDVLRTNYPLVPNNFKLTGGAAMMWNYNNDHRVNIKFKTKSKTGELRYKNKNFGIPKYNKVGVFSQKLIKGMQPSLGLNITYLDFTTAESFELGVGPTLGLFNNLLYISGGVNLMELKEKPGYIGLGFSFVNLGTKIKEIQTGAAGN